MSQKAVKIVVYVPEGHAEAVREALAAAGAGKIGNYSHASFSIKGTGRFLPLEGAHPAIGKVGKMEEVAEERIESVCYQKDLEKVLEAVLKVHPYEEPAVDVYPLVFDPWETSKRKS